MESRGSRSLGKVEPRIALGLCLAVLGSRAAEPLVRHRPAYAGAFAPYWLPLAAAGLAAAGIMRLNGHGVPFDRAARAPLTRQER